MLCLNTENLERVSPEHGLSRKEVLEQQEKLESFLNNIKNRNQGFYECIDDNETIEKIEKFARENKSKYSNIVVLGIGGSALGTICLQQSLKHLFENELKTTATKLHVLDNIDPSLIANIEDVIDYEKTLFLLITKSGTTPETIAQYLHFRQKIEEKMLKPQDHMVFVTDPESGDLRKIAKQENFTAFDIPQNVGGRFSVLTAVGLLPAALIDINIRKLIEGARLMRDKFLNTNPNENDTFLLASIQYMLEQKGKTNNVMIPYSQKLIRFADWYRQLLAESIGKKLDNDGKAVYTGITPINALGVTDQHSQSQLYNEGPNDKFFIFIEVENQEPVTLIPNHPLHTQITFNKLMQIEQRATEESLTKNDRPNITIKIDCVNEENLGKLFLLFEGATAFLGEFYNIDAFNQPGVELSKKLTKEALEKL